MTITPSSFRVVRRVQQAAGSVIVTDVEEEWFRAELITPNGNTSAFPEGSPRGFDPYFLRYSSGTLGPRDRAPARPAERVESSSEQYECLGLVRNLRTGQRISGVEVAVLPITTLYPYTAELQEQGGGTVLTDLPLALWAPSDDSSDHGQYSLYEAECPPEFAPEFMVKNRAIFLNDVTFRIVDPFLVIQAPRIRFTLRGPR